MNPAFVRRSLAWSSLGLSLLLGTEAAAARPVTLPDDGRGRLADGRVMSARDDDPRWGLEPAVATSAAWRRWRAAVGPSWVSWDRVTGIPRRILVQHGHPTPGVLASAAEAERVGHALLAAHLDLLAPGSDIGDFVLVTNDRSAGIRTLGWTQHHRGRPVHGGQVSLRFANDRLVAVGSEAWPNVAVAPATTPRAASDLRRDAETWLATDVPGTLRADSTSAPILLPVRTPSGLSYREVIEVVVEATHPRSRWSVYLDASTGAPIARRQTLTFATSTLRYGVPVRNPQGARSDFPSTYNEIVVDGAPQTTDAAGTVTFVGPTGAVSTSLQGPFGTVFNAAGATTSVVLPLSDGVDAIFAAPDDELTDAQLTSWIHAHVVKEYVRGIDPTLAWLDTQIPITVNIDDECNANSDGNAINFFRASPACENTGRIADVVYHEFGHSVHAQSILPGVGSFDTALSEGVSDYLSATMTGDTGLARGFFYDDTPLRELDPPGEEAVWPEDNGEVHYAGLIIGGALWDLRKLLVAQYGPELGVTLTDRIYYEATRRAVDIPSMYAESLVVDDDDGDLSNGTPNACAINEAYGPHGLFSPLEAAEQVYVDGNAVTVEVAIPSFPDCPVDATAELDFKQRGESDAQAQTIPMQPGPGGFTAELPPGVVGEVQNYRVRMHYSTGAERSLPDNFADPWYERFIGEVEVIYCTSFETGSTDWLLPPGTAGFSVGPPPAVSAVDPTTPAGADPFVLGSALSGTGEYEPFSNAVATSPVIEIPPGYDAVRLQYRRWLTVEDGFYDQAAIEANGVEVWSNFASADGDLASVHHRDREWRFHDVDLTDLAASGTLELSYRLVSDQGLHFGGWTADELCVVGFDAGTVICGNGFVEAGETCDDGNVVDGDGCSADCTDELPPGSMDPDGGVDDGAGTGGGDGDTDGPNDGSDPGAEGELIGRGCACASGRRPSSPAWAWALVLLAVLRARRRPR